ncbi:MAG TPA: GtrA family protein [Anaeromyxobacteraceae bacterium]
MEKGAGVEVDLEVARGVAAGSGELGVVPAGKGAAPVALSMRERLLRFAAVGLSGVAVNLGLLWLLAEVLRLREVLASAAAIEVSILWNFALNSMFTYRDRNAGAAVTLAARALRYNLVSLVGLALQLGTFVLLRALLLRGLERESLGAWRYPAQCAGIALATAWNYTGNLRFTWRQAPAAREATP